MTTFKEIRGTAIQVVSSDPSNPEIGQIWYNSSSGTLKGYKTVNAWSSGGNLNTARYQLAAAGTQTAALAFGGDVGPPLSAATESYNGTSWTTVNSMATARHQLAGAGTQTAALALGGYFAPTVQTAAVESWNGTSWTSGVNLPAAERLLGANGTQTATLTFGGSPDTTSSNKFNGTSWTSAGTLNTGRVGLAIGAAGTQTAGIAIGGDSPKTAVESYNGTSWTTIASTSTSADRRGTCGTQTLSLVFGGGYNPPVVGTTELWNGSAWTTNPTGLATARYSLAGAGTQTAGLAFAGITAPGANSASTEEFTGIGTQTITVS